VLLGMAATQLGVSATSLTVESGGHNTDTSIAAALLSQAVGKPVRVHFMRWDEHGWDQFGPAQSTDVRAGIDGSGRIVAYDYTSYQHGWTQVVETSAQLAGTPLPAVAPAGGADTTSAGSFYAIPNRRVTGVSVNGYDGFQGHLPPRPRGAAGAVRLRADDRRARARSRARPDRLSCPEHRRDADPRRRPLDRRPRRRREGLGLEAERRRVVPRDRQARQGSRASRSAGSRTRSRRSWPT
jgi:hypothetical protein